MTTEFTDDWYDPESTTFGDRIAGAREAAGMDQKMLSKRLGVKISTLQAWENDMAEPRANKLSMMAGMLNVSLLWLLEGVGDGLDAPTDGIGETGTVPDLAGVLGEIRALKAQAKHTANRLATLEKRLIAAWKGESL